MNRLFRNALMMMLAMTVICGVIYPLAVTAAAQVLFPKQANGSLVTQNGKVVGSSLIGQNFDNPKYFWGRPSATSPGPNLGTASNGSNLGPTNPALRDAVQQRIDALHQADPGNNDPVPVDLVSASGSGLDPEISPAAADYQVARVARVRNLDVAQVRAAVSQATVGRQLGIFGEARVNVLQLNLALDSMRAR